MQTSLVSKQHTYLSSAVDLKDKIAKTTVRTLSGLSPTIWQILGESSEAALGALGLCQISECWS